MARLIRSLASPCAGGGPGAGAAAAGNAFSSSERLDLISVFLPQPAVSKAIRHHHERIDGAGYPDGLIADEIPWMARVISVADAYDAMTARGSYKRPRTMPDAVVELRRVAGAQLDARFVDVFIGRLVDPVVAPRRELVL